MEIEMDKITITMVRKGDASDDNRYVVKINDVLCSGPLGAKIEAMPNLIKNFFEVMSWK